MTRTDHYPDLDNAWANREIARLGRPDLEQADLAGATFTVRCDLPRANEIDSMVTVPLAGVAGAMAALAAMVPGELTWGESPAVIEIRRVS